MKLQANELEFMENQADKNKTYIPQPKTFKFKNGVTYRPDFYCVEDKEYIEITNSYDTYHHRKKHYKLMESEYPKIKFKVITISVPRTTVSFEKSVHEKLRKLAYKGRVSINSIINKIIEEYFINR